MISTPRHSSQTILKINTIEWLIILVALRQTKVLPNPPTTARLGNVRKKFEDVFQGEVSHDNNKFT